MEELDKVVTQEMYFDRQKIEEDAEESYNDLLIWIVGALKSGKSQKEIKKEIKSRQIQPNLQSDMGKMFSQQHENITGKERKFNMAQEAVAGQTFTEAVKAKKADNVSKAIRFMAQAAEAVKGNLPTDQLIKVEIRRFSQRNDAFWRDHAKSAREYAYQDLDATTNRQLRGWMSVAVLDSKTSAICAGYHNRFYDAKEYKARSDVPNKPPRHPNCRSILLSVWKGTDIRQFKGQKLETFLRRNPKVAQDMMGKRKYKLWSEGKAKIDKYVDLQGGRWFTNDEIIKRLGIKSAKRLAK